MFRRAANTGVFSGLKVPMQMRAVRQAASRGGVGLKGVKVRIVRDKELLGKGVFGYTHPNGKMIDLYPDAFSSMENLVKTLGHERMHIMQIKLHGRPSSAGAVLNEAAAYGTEGQFWNYFRGVLQ